MSNEPATTEIEVRERHQTGGYQEVIVTYTRAEIRETFGTDDSSLVSVLLNKLEAAEQKLKMYEDFVNAPGDVDWGPPHPIFLLAQQRDNFMQKLKRIGELCESTRHVMQKANGEGDDYVNDPLCPSCLHRSKTNE